MLDHCARPSCPGVRVIRTAQTYGFVGRRWFCSVECSDLVNRVVHWIPEGHGTNPCSAVWLRDKPWLLTSVLLAVTCENCKRTGLYKEALAAAA